MKYTIERFNGQPARHADSMKDAIRIAREWLGVDRVYKSAEYQTDRPAASGGREMCYGLDIWRERKNVTREMFVPADVVITWREK